jgi:DNA polymerase-3 subunit beta
LSNIQGLTGRKSNLAITETVLIQTTDSSIKITATDLETGFKKNI